MHKHYHFYTSAKKLIVIAIAAVVSLCMASCAIVSQLEKQAIISAVGIDKGENARFKVSAQVFQAMGAGSSTAFDSSKTNTIIVSAEADTIAECMEKISLTLGRRINTGHNKYIVIGKDALSIPLSDCLDYFIRNEQTYLGVPVISSIGDAREIIDVKMQNEVETAMAVENIISNAVDNGEAVKVDLLKIANSKTTALPVIKTVKPPQSDEDNSEKENTELIFSGTRIVRDGKILYTASQEETQGYCWLEGRLRSSQLCVNDGDRLLNVTVTRIHHKDTIRSGDDGNYEMVYKVDARVKLLDSFSGDDDKICRYVEEMLEKRCSDCFLKLSEIPDADFLGVTKTAHSVYPRDTLGMTDMLLGCRIYVDFTCSLDK